MSSKRHVIDLTQSDQETIDTILSTDDEIASNDIQVCGKYTSGAIMTTTYIGFNEILETSDLKKAILTSYVIDEEWLLPKLSRVSQVALCIDGGHKASLNAFQHRSYKNITVITPAFPKFPNYGVQHCKMMLLFYPNFLRIVISSGNLVPYDYDEVHNIVFIQDLKLMEIIFRRPSEFKSDLLKISRHLGIKEEFLSDAELSKYDWSPVVARMVYSVPGYQNVTNFPSGLCMLSRMVNKKPFKTLECQGSSLGSMSKKWLDDVLTCASGAIPVTEAHPVDDKSIRIVFPTSKYANTSDLGPLAFGTIFCQSKNWNASDYPKDLFYQCESRPFEGHPLHSKIITAFDTFSPVWHYVGSANFTASAWGYFVKNNTLLIISNYELGIVIDASSTGGVFPYPYKRPPAKYNYTDVPWMQDVEYR